jgi:rifampin ADP-ribosylating transferase
MTVIDDPDRGAASADPGPFVVSHPCPACRGQGATGGQPCPRCHGTGVSRFFHGTKADLEPGDLIAPGRSPNFGDRERTTNYVYLTGTLDAATWGAELALGEGPGRIYVVEPTGPSEDDPNLTDKKFPGNPTRSYRSRAPLRITGEVTDWRGHSPRGAQGDEERSRGAQAAGRRAGRRLRCSPHACQASTEAGVQDQPKQPSRSSRGTVKHQIAPVCLASPGTRQEPWWN